MAPCVSVTMYRSSSPGHSMVAQTDHENKSEFNRLSKYNNRGYFDLRLKPG